MRNILRQFVGRKVSVYGKDEDETKSSRTGRHDLTADGVLGEVDDDGSVLINGVVTGGTPCSLVLSRDVIGTIVILPPDSEKTP